MSLVPWTIWLTLAGMAILSLPVWRHSAQHKWVALITALSGLAMATIAFLSYDISAGGVQGGLSLPWLPSLGISFSLGADGISVVLCLLTGLVAVSGVLFSWNIEKNSRAFFLLFLGLVGGVYGVFLANDLFLIFFFYELAIIPKFFLIAIWGHTRKDYAAMKLVLYSLVSSAAVLLGILLLVAASGTGSFDMQSLAAAKISEPVQIWLFPLLFLGFGVLAGLWPFHTWAPTGHVAAPTAASMLLAGVVMKLGAYGCLRVAVQLCPAGAAHWSGWVCALGAIAILFAALIALRQRDFKFVIGYSSVSHMGFVILGLGTLNATGLAGAVMQMFSHGVIAGLLFAVVGRMIYERTHTRMFGELSDLRHRLPFAFWTFVLAGAASMGLPGFSGFIAEIQVLIGTWKSQAIWLVPTVLGMAVTFAYTLQALHQGFFTPAAQGDTHASEQLPSITLPEKVAALLLLSATLWAGLNPEPLNRRIYPAVSAIAERVAAATAPAPQP